MTEDIRQDRQPVDDVDRREPTNATHLDERADRRDLEHLEDRPAPADDPDVVREGEARRDGDVVREGEARRDGDVVREGEARRDGDVVHEGEARGQGDATRAMDDRDTNRDPTSERRPAASPGASTSWRGEGLLSTDDRGSYQQRWDEIQVRIIDEPRQCVREADDLVGEVTTRISDRFSGARQDMERRWDGGDEPTTEELRQAVQRYRDFFQRLVAQ
jgi:hypothetical protein